MKWIVGAVTAAAISLSGWNLTATTDNQSRISAVEERASGLLNRLDRIEDKLDWLIQERVKDHNQAGEPVRPSVTPRRHSRSYEAAP